MFIAIIGTHAAGKTTVARYLEKQGFTRIDLMEILQQEASRRDMEQSRDVLLSLANELREKYGPGALVQDALHRVNGATHVVIDAIQNLAEVEFLVREGPTRIVGVDADLERRFERAAARQRERGRDEGAASLAQFRARDDVEREGDEMRLGTTALFAVADATIRNDASLDDLRKEVRRTLALFKQDALPSRRRA